MTQLLIQRFQVPLEYPVVFTRDVFSAENNALAQAISRREPQRRQRCLCVIEQRVAELWPELAARFADYVRAHSATLEQAAETLVIPGAEECKNDPDALPRLHAYFEAARMDRHSTVIIVGGGGLQDLVGYAAATTHRGVRVVRVPTTVLSQADSGVGVKNGINAFGKKNFLGTFAAPYAVIIDPDFLRTLPRLDAVAGMAEAIKVALIKDPAFFAWMRTHVTALARVEDSEVSHLVRRCAELHLTHIATAGDPFEFGSARPLDFGHWSAHKLESMTHHRLSHGEAVAIGIAIDTRYCIEAGMLSEADGETIISLIEQLGLAIWDTALEREGPKGLEVLQGLEEFREHLGGELTVTLLDGIGCGREVHALDLALLRKSLSYLRTRARRHASDAHPSATP
ncbi:MAG TPA: 3-dehydroquinate synthase [Polyangiales bacterium]|nr:3-dehydroquinate synthase [Polyangiales bacterium]